MVKTINLGFQTIFLLFYAGSLFVRAIHKKEYFFKLTRFKVTYLKIRNIIHGQTDYTINRGLKVLYLFNRFSINVKRTISLPVYLRSCYYFSYYYANVESTKKFKKRKQKTRFSGSRTEIYRIRIFIKMSVYLRYINKHIKGFIVTLCR